MIFSSVNSPNFSFFGGENICRVFYITKLKKKTLEFVNAPSIKFGK